MIHNPIHAMIQELDTTQYIRFDRMRFEGKLEVRNDSSHYARIVTHESGTAHLNWIQGKGSGNILLVGILQEMIRFDCNILLTRALPRDNMKHHDLLRFYSQIGLYKSKGVDEYTLTGEPFQSGETRLFLERVKSTLKL